MRIHINDYGGYAFILSLSEALASRGHEILHTYCASLQTTPPGMNQVVNDNLEVRGLDVGSPLNKYNFLKRWQQERIYGRLAADACAAFNPEVVLSANMPLDAQRMLLKQSRKMNARFFFWLQDMLGIAARDILSRKLGLPGRLVGQHYVRMEDRLLQRSNHVISIADTFRPYLAGIGIPAEKITCIPNWAPLEALPVLAKDNAWAREQGLTDQFCFLYSGSLGLKHDPSLLLELARSLEEKARVVVITEGMGASWLRENGATLKNLLVLPFQEKERLREVLATADVLVGLLSEEAGSFSVPSKLSTYLCAGRPILAALPEDNPASAMLNDHQAGLVTSPGDHAAFTESAHRLLVDKYLREQMSLNGRALAEKLFDLDRITDRFEEILGF